MAALSLAAVLSLSSVALAAPAGDQVLSLPGWKDALPSRIFSGHIDVGGDVQDGVARTMHMWCVRGSHCGHPAMRFGARATPRAAACEHHR